MTVFEKLILRKQRAALTKIAKQEYELARGTSHAKLLRDARIRIEKKLESQQNKLAMQDYELGKIENQLDIRLKESLEKHIVNTYLCEIPGIGTKLQQLILTYVFKGNLSDLRKAFYINGIGDAKQYEINKWVDEYERKIPELLKGTFPEKSAIVVEFSEKKQEVRVRIENLKNEITNLENQIKTIDEKLKVLDSVSINDFIEVRLNPDILKPNIDNYLQGLFGEWEPTPEWFKEIIGVE